MASRSAVASPAAGGSRIPNFFKMDVEARIDALCERGLVTEGDLRALKSGEHTLALHVADKMIENVVGVFGLPLGLGLNFLIDGRDYVVPLSVEEPSIVAGLSGAARTARLSGGFETSATDPILIGQVQVVHVPDIERGAQALLDRKGEILNLANSLHPKMVARGGGARDVEAFIHPAPEDGGANTDMLVLHLLVDTRDAMGANIVNGMCEGVASLVEAITGGKVFLRILSNLADRALVRARVRIPVQNLAVKNFSGTEVRDGIVLANDLALADPYRAATHNKGIMNGVDAIAIATGNDFRAIEAAAHAYAARDGRYRGLTRWHEGPDGDLIGELAMPMKVGTVGGSLETNPTVRLNHRLLGSPNAAELARVMGAVGLAQNYAALRALATAGIQQNHMTLHARSVASAAGVPEHLFDDVVEALIESGDIKVWKAEELIRRFERTRRTGQDDVVAAEEPRSSACGKVILLGEHAVVYGRSALAVPIPLAVEARVVDAAHDVTLVIPRWGVEQRVPPVTERPAGAAGILALLLERLHLANRGMTIEVFPNVPRAMGLGGSSALAVSVIRALDMHFGLRLAAEEINAFAFECERAAHGTPSGVDNTLATYGTTMLFRAAKNGTPAEFKELMLAKPLPVVIGLTGKESLTASSVARVADAWRRNRPRYEGIFDQIEALTRAGADAARDGDLTELGELMNICHGYLNALQVSTRELEELVHIARRHGAAGAKLTGGGGGGSVVALCPDGTEAVAVAVKEAGYEALAVEIR